MADPSLVPCVAWHSAPGPGRHGATEGMAGVTLTSRRSFPMASLTARRGQAAALVSAAAESWGVELPTTPRRTEVGGCAFIWMGPERWLVTNEHDDALAERLGSTLGRFATVAEQSDGRAVLRIGGLHARAALAKLLPIDLHPRAFRPGDTALTAASHMHVHIWQLDSAPTYDLAVFRSLGSSLLAWLTDAAAEFGADLIVESDT